VQTGGHRIEQEHAQLLERTAERTHPEL
jgi:hypothetical protein